MTHSSVHDDFLRKHRLFSSPLHKPVLSATDLNCGGAGPDRGNGPGEATDRTGCWAGRPAQHSQQHHRQHPAIAACGVLSL